MSNETAVPPSEAARKAYESMMAQLIDQGLSHGDRQQALMMVLVAVLSQAPGDPRSVISNAFRVGAEIPASVIFYLNDPANRRFLGIDEQLYQQQKAEAEAALHRSSGRGMN